MNYDELNQNIARVEEIEVYLRPTTEDDEVHQELCYGLFYKRNGVEGNLNYYHVSGDKKTFSVNVPIYCASKAGIDAKAIFEVLKKKFPFGYATMMQDVSFTEDYANYNPYAKPGKNPEADFEFELDGMSFVYN